MFGFVLVLLFMCVCCHGYKVAILSDTHANIRNSPSCFPGHDTSGSSAPKYWCDPPESLTNSALAHLKTVEECFDFIVVTGDLLRHSSYSGPLNATEGLETFSLFQQQVDSFFHNCPNPHPIIALGNNDLLQRYPAPGTSGAWLKQVASNWAILQSVSKDTRNEFIQSGFYAVDFAPVKLRIAVLHTNYWSSHNAFTVDMADPAGGFAWLSKTLTEAQQLGYAVWIVGHIPPGMDHYVAPPSYDPSPDYSSAFLEKFTQTVTPFLTSKTIRSMMFGHEHTIMERRLVTGLPVEIPLFMHGSVSPDKGNNPSVRVYSVSQDLYVTDLEDFYLDLSQSSPSWKVRRFPLVVFFYFSVF